MLAATQLPNGHQTALATEARSRIQQLLPWAREMATASDPTRAACGRLLISFAGQLEPSTLFDVGGLPVLATRGDPSSVTVTRQERHSVRNRIEVINLFVAARPRWVATVLVTGVIGFISCGLLTLGGLLPTRLSAQPPTIGTPLTAETTVSTASANLEVARNLETALRARVGDLISNVADRRQSCPTQPASSTPRPCRRLPSERYKKWRTIRTKRTLR